MADVPRRWWRCQSCRKTIGEIVGDRVVIKIGDRVIIAPLDGIEQTCSCGTRCVVECEPTSQAG